MGFGIVREGWRSRTSCDKIRVFPERTSRENRIKPPKLSWAALGLSRDVEPN